MIGAIRAWEAEVRRQAALDLHAQIKAAVEEPDGSWPGADLVQLVSLWLVANGVPRSAIDGGEQP